MAGGDPANFSEEYETAVKANRAEIERLSKKHPGSKLAGEVASLIVPGMPVFKAAKAATGLGKVLKSVGTGAAIGGAEVAGRQDELDAGDITAGAIAGGVGGLMIGSVSAGAGKVAAEYLKKNPETAGWALGGWKGALTVRAGKKLFKKKKGDEPTIEDYKKWDLESQQRSDKQIESDMMERIKQADKNKELDIKSQTKALKEQDKDLLKRIKNAEPKPETETKRPKLSPNWDFPVRKTRKGMK
jgi:hypothetical protein